MTDFCDCATLEPAAPAGGVALYTPSTHVRRRLEVLLGLAGLSPQAEGPALVLLGNANLEPLCVALSATERGEVRAAPWRDGAAQPWEAVPLEHWVRRARSGWFGEAAAHLDCHLQPLVRLADGSRAGLESLIRAHLGSDLIGAGPLLEAAQAHGGLRAFDAEARAVALRRGYGRLEGGESLFINFMPGVIYNPEVCLSTTFAVCREVGADFSRLVFEVTESETFPDLGMLRTILERYRREGARVALDDLGAGHTSLLYLAELRPDFVKLDRALVSGITGGDPRVDLIGALVRYSHDLGVAVVAEGIEILEELELVVALGADYGQGLLLGRPEPLPGPLPEAVAARLRRGPLENGLEGGAVGAGN